MSQKSYPESSSICHLPFSCYYRLHDVKLSGWEQFHVVLINKDGNRLLKSNLDKCNVSLRSQFLKVKQILFFLLYIITKQTHLINLIITDKSPPSATTSKKITLACFACLCFRKGANKLKATEGKNASGYEVR